MRRTLPFMSHVSAEELGVGEDEPIPEPEAVPSADDPQQQAFATREPKPKKVSRPIFTELVAADPTIMDKPKSA